MLGQSLLAQSLLAMSYPELMQQSFPQVNVPAGYGPLVEPQPQPTLLGQVQQGQAPQLWPPMTPQVSVPKPVRVPAGGFAQQGNTQPSKLSAPYEQYIMNASKTHGVPPEVIRSVIMRESSFNPKDVSNANAQGLMQLIPSTARAMGVTNAFDPEQNIMGGTKYLAQMYKKFGRWDLAFAAYNAGPGAVQKYGGVPPYKETQTYVKRLMYDIGYR